MKHIKTYKKFFELAGYSYEEYVDYITNELSKCNLRSVQIRELLDFYSDDIKEYLDSGKYPQLFVDYLMSKLDISKSNDIRNAILPKQNIQQIKYL